MENQRWKRIELSELDVERYSSSKEETIKYPEIYNLKSPGPEWWEERKKRKDKMKIIDFYRGECGNPNGDYLERILEWTDGQLEMDHDWVQWTFPSNEVSMMNSDAPTMTTEESAIFKADPELQNKVKQSFVRMLRFLGFNLTQDNEVVLVEPKDDNVPWWLRGAFNHNCLRMTRMLKSLRLTGLDKYALAMYDCLCEFRDCVSDNTWSHWQNAVIEPLW
jgi:hypothetical protein